MHRQRKDAADNPWQGGPHPNWEYHIQVAEYVRLQRVAAGFDLRLAFEDVAMDLALYHGNALLVCVEAPLLGGLQPATRGVFCRMPWSPRLGQLGAMYGAVPMSEDTTPMWTFGKIGIRGRKARSRGCRSRSDRCSALITEP